MARSGAVQRPNDHGHRAEPPVISSRYLSLEDRLAIADGLANAQSMTAIAERIGKSTSTVSREITNRSQAGLYLPLSSTQRGSRGSRSTCRPNWSPTCRCGRPSEEGWRSGGHQRRSPIV